MTGGGSGASPSTSAACSTPASSVPTPRPRLPPRADNGERTQDEACDDGNLNSCDAAPPLPHRRAGVFLCPAGRPATASPAAATAWSCSPSCATTATRRGDTRTAAPPPARSRSASSATAAPAPCTSTAAATTWGRRGRAARRQRHALRRLLRRLSERAQLWPRRLHVEVR